MNRRLFMKRGAMALVVAANVAPAAALTVVDASEPDYMVFHELLDGGRPFIREPWPEGNLDPLDELYIRRFAFAHGISPSRLSSK